jgi:hypothetical protein
MIEAREREEREGARRISGATAFQNMQHTQTAPSPTEGPAASVPRSDVSIATKQLDMPTRFDPSFPRMPAESSYQPESWAPNTKTRGGS